MSDKELAKKAFELAEQEAQEKQIAKIKGIVQNYLEKIQAKTDERRKLDDEIRILKADVDDLKAGRLDKIKERQEKEPKAAQISPIVIKIVEKEYIPLQPWRSRWEIEWRRPYLGPTYDVWSSTTATNLLNTVGTMTASSLSSATSCNAVNLLASGTTVANFTGGTYTVGNNTVIL